MLRKLLSINLDSPFMKAFDWCLAAASLGYGIQQESALWIACGIVGAIAAWWRPMGRLQAFVQGAVKRRPAASR